MGWASIPGEGASVLGKRKNQISASIDVLQHHEIIESLIDTRPGDHICVLYEYSPAEQIEPVTSFIAEGLEQGEQCIYVADDLPVKEVEGLLAAGGIDVAAHGQRSALMIWGREHWRSPGVLDTIRKAAQVREIVESAFAAGFTGVRFAVEMTWTLKPDIEAHAIEEWESYSNELLSGAPVRAMCLYGRKRLARDVVDAGMRTHPLVLDNGEVRRNERFGG